MALVQGTVSVADDGTVTKSDAAGRLFDLLKASGETLAGKTFDETPENYGALNGYAILANAISEWMVTEITTNATAKIPKNDGVDHTGDYLQQIDVLSVGAPTIGPNIDKFLPIV